MSPYSWGGGGGDVWRTNNSSPWLPICSPACLPVCLLLCLSAFLSFNRTSDASFSGRLPPKEERCLKPMLGVCLYVCPSHTHTHTRTRAHTHTHRHRHTHSCTLTHTHRRTHARTRTHAHSRAHSLARAHTYTHTVQLMSVSGLQTFPVSHSHWQHLLQIGQEVKNTSTN